MPINTEELLNVVAVLSNDKNLRVTVKESVKGGLIAGAGALLGGLLLGPRGIAVGGVIGACSAAVMSMNEFRSVADVIMNDMSYAQQERLAASVRAVISDLRIEDATVLLPVLMKNGVAQKAVLRMVTEFITKEMQLQIID